VKQSPETRKILSKKRKKKVKTIAK